MKKAILLSVLASTALLATEPATTMTCKKLYFMQDVEQGTTYKKELHDRCSQTVLKELDELAAAYAKEKDANVKHEIVEKMMKLEDKLEVK